jgi:uncharacterized protein (TIGR03032 family)
VETILTSPVFVVSAPFSGDALLVNSLARASGVWRSRTPPSTFLDAVDGVDPAARDWDSHRLTADDAPPIAEAARKRLTTTVVDREGNPPGADAGPIRALTGGMGLALRVPLLAAVFPDARFLFSFRDPTQSTAEMVDAWRSERFVNCPGLPGWEGAPWSLPLIPGWRSLRGRSVEEIVVAQWAAITDVLIADLEALEPTRWAVSEVAALLEDPRGELRRLCAFLEIPYDQALLTPVEAARRTLAAHAARPSPELVAQLHHTDAVAARARELLADPDPPAASSAGSGTETSPFHSVSTGSFTQLLRRLRSSLLVSTYQSGKLICARDRERHLNTHFRDFDKPMGIAVAPGRFALATRTEVWDFRDMPAVAPKLEPTGRHDACFLPRNRHVTGDALMHEMAFAGGELWAVATAFSCLVTLDADHSFVPRWNPPFITRLVSGDRCHLNGLAVRDDRVAYVTALGQTDEPGGWRKGKATGGCLMDVASSEIVCAGLSMPHSPRWHDGRLWLLESGRGELITVDLDTGDTETVIELPGFTRGLALTGELAFVGLSQIRESSTFGDLPLTDRLQERVCGVWAVDLRRGEIAGFLRFEDIVQEIFDVALLSGVRFPEIAEPASTATSTSFVLP